MASYELNFQNWQHWKCLIPRGPFKEIAYCVTPPPHYVILEKYTFMEGGQPPLVVVLGTPL